MARKKTNLMAVTQNGNTLDIIIPSAAGVQTMEQMKKLVREKKIVGVKMRIMRDTGETIELKEQTTFTF
jgi:hypothetical protein